MKLLTFKNAMIFLALISFIVLGCKDAPKEVEDNVVVNELTDANFKTIWDNVEVLWEKSDPALIPSVYADSFVRISPGGKSTSASELANEINAVKVAFPDMDLKLVRYDLCGEMASVHWTVDGNFTGEVAGLTGNGKPYSVKGITMMTVEDGNIVKDDSYWDTYAVFAQTGGYAIVVNEVSQE